MFHTIFTVPYYTLSSITIPLASHARGIYNLLLQDFQLGAKMLWMSMTWTNWVRWILIWILKWWIWYSGVNNRSYVSKLTLSHRMRYIQWSQEIQETHFMISLFNIGTQNLDCYNQMIFIKLKPSNIDKINNKFTNSIIGHKKILPILYKTSITCGNSILALSWLNTIHRQ